MWRLSEDRFILGRGVGDTPDDAEKQGRRLRPK
jgi:hypothetical protein